MPINEKMNVLHVNSYYAAGKFYKNLFEIQRKHINIKTYVPVEYGFIENFDYGKYTTLDKTFSKYDRLFFHVKHKKIIKNIKKTYSISNFKIVHAHSLFSNGYVAYKLRKEFGIPYVVAVRNTDVNVFFEKMIHLRKLGVNILEKAEAIVFLSNTYKEKVLDKYIPADKRKGINNKSFIIPNGIDEFWIENSRTNAVIEKNKINIVTAGEINKNKNQITVCKICQKLIDEGYEIKYSIAGKISDKKVYNQIRQYDFVEYRGVLNKEELADLYNMSDIFILLSQKETFGLVYAEALSQGLPLLYTKGEGFDKQFQEGHVGYPVKSDDINYGVKKVKSILNNYNKLSVNAVAGCRKFDWTTIEEEYRKIYYNILKER